MNTQGNLYVSGRLVANENHTLWFWRWRTFSSTSSRDIQWLVTFQCYHIPCSDLLCSTKRVMCTDTLKISLGYAVRNSQKLLQRDFQKLLKRLRTLRSPLLSVIEITTADNLHSFRVMRSDSRNNTTEKSLPRVCYISRSTQQMYCMDFRLGEPEPTTACSYNATHDGKKLWRFYYISESTQQLYCMDFSLGEPERICNMFL